MRRGWWDVFVALISMSLIGITAAIVFNPGLSSVVTSVAVSIN
jgi:hypothetical protein